MKKSFKGSQLNDSKYFKQPVIHRRKSMNELQVLPVLPEIRVGMKSIKRKKIYPDQQSVELAEAVLYSDSSSTVHDLLLKLSDATANKQIKVPTLKSESNLEGVSLEQQLQLVCPKHSIVSNKTENLSQIDTLDKKSDPIDNIEVVLYEEKLSWWEDSSFIKLCMFFVGSLFGNMRDEEKELQMCSS